MVGSGTLEQWRDTEATPSGGVVTVKVNGQPVFSVNDTSHTAGKIALYSWADAGARFDDVVVTSVGGPPPCTYAINPTSASVVAAGGSGSVSVTAGAGCNWTAVSNAGWITVTSGASGSGNGTVGYSVAANGSSSQRQGTVTIAGQTFTVTQAGSQVVFSDDFSSGSLAGWTVVDQGTIDAPSNWQVVSGELRQTSNIYSNSGDPGGISTPGTYLLTGDAGWSGYSVSVRMKSSDNDALGVMFGYQNGSNYYRFSMDQSRNYRRLVKVVNGTWTQLAQDTQAYTQNVWYQVEASLAGGVVTVKVDGQPILQASDSSFSGGKIALFSWANAGSIFDDVVVTAAGGGGGCTYSISPTSASLGAAGGSGSVSVTAGAGCNWTAVSNAGWITVTSGASGTGNGSVGYSVAANGGPGERQGTITIAGQTFTVTQAGTSGGAGPSVNTGQLWQMKNWITGEEVTYSYDELGRLAAAQTTGPEWGQSFGYDGFGNLVSQTVTKGTAPSLSVLADPATNRIVGASYDANGNLLGGGYSYDVENRLVSAGGEQYAYDGNNRRVWKRRQVREEEYRLEVYFYGLGGERLGTYEAVRNGATLTFETVVDNLYFGGRLLRSGREVVAVDRLGSVRWRRNLDTGATATFDYWPYGQEKPQATAQEREKFGTYYRDATGLDYADQRYYASTSGRFLTADPFVTSTALGNPTRGWNRYAYVEGDPVNLTDPSGLCVVPGFCFEWPRFIPGFPGSPGGVAGGGNFYTGPNLEVPPDFQLGLQGDLATAYGPPVDWVTTTEARRLLDKRLEGFEGTNCDRVFGEVLTAAGIPYSAERLRQTSKRTNFYNVRDPAYANLTQHQVVGNNNMKTLNNSLPYGWSAYTIHGAAGAAVLLPKDWSVQPDVGDRLVHEVLHALTEWSDDQMFENFAKYGLVRTSPGTQDITDWIARDCKEKKR